MKKLLIILSLIGVLFGQQVINANVKIRGYLNVTDSYTQLDTLETRALTIGGVPIVYLTAEQIQDLIGAMVTGNTETLVTISYQDGDGTIDFVVDNDLANYSNANSGFITATLTEEQVEDFIGGMLAGTETLISVAYDDAGGMINFVVDEASISHDAIADVSTSDHHVKTVDTDDQTIDVFSETGNTISLSLEDDGEANQTLDISGIDAIALNTAKVTDDDDGVDEVYAAGWNADTDSPEKDDVYDYLHQIDTDDDADVDNFDATALAAAIVELDPVWLADSSQFAVIAHNETITGAYSYSAAHSLTNELDMTGANVLIDINPAGVGSANIIDITPTAILTTNEAVWKGINVNGNTLDPSANDSKVIGIEVDFSTLVPTGTNPYIEGVELIMPFGYNAIDIEEGVFELNNALPNTAYSNFTGINGIIDGTLMAATSEYHFIDVAVSGGIPSGEISALGTHTNVDVIHQDIGTFSTPSQTEFAGEKTGGGASWVDGVDGSEIFVVNSDEVYVGSAAQFTDIEVIMTSEATRNIAPTFWYNTAADSWSQFYPEDDTDGFQQNGTIRFSDISAVWTGDGDPGGAETTVGYWIKIIRTVNADPGTPTPTTMKTGVDVNYYWNKDALVYVANISSVGYVKGATYGSDASVSDAELLYINSLSSNAQTQFGAKADTTDNATRTNITNRISDHTGISTAHHTRFATSEETDQVWVSDSTDYLMKNMFNDSLAVADISLLETDPIWLADSSTYLLKGQFNDSLAAGWITESQITDLTHFVVGDEADQVWVSDSTDYLMKNQFNDSLAVSSITESQISDLAHFTTGDELDPQWVADSSAIITAIELNTAKVTDTVPDSLAIDALNFVPDLEYTTGMGAKADTTDNATRTNLAQYFLRSDSTGNDIQTKAENDALYTNFTTGDEIDGVWTSDSTNYLMKGQFNDSLAAGWITESQITDLAHFTTGDELDPQWVADSSAIITAIELNTAKVTDTVPDSLAIDALNFVPDLEYTTGMGAKADTTDNATRTNLAQYFLRSDSTGNDIQTKAENDALYTNFTTGDEIDGVWISDSTDYLMKNQFNDSLAVSSITESQISDLDHFVNADEIDGVWTSDSTDYLMKGQFNDSLNIYIVDYLPLDDFADSLGASSITESQISDLDHFVNADETDQVWVSDSTNYLMKGMFNDSLAVSSITESQISDLDHFTNSDETDQVWVSDSTDYLMKTALAGAETDGVWTSDSTDYLMKGQFNDSLAAGWITESQITDLVHFTTGDEIDQVWTSDSTDYLMKNQFNDSLAVSSITESQISDLDHFQNSDETDQVWVSDSTDYLMKGQFNDSLAAGWITESQITDLVHFTTGDELDPQWVADSSAIISAIELNTAKVTDTVPDSLDIDALNFVPDLELTNYATGVHFTTGDEIDGVWTSDSTDYLMKNMFNDSLAVSSITESQISDLVHFTTGDELDGVWTSDSTNYLMKGQFNDSLAAGWITESQITDLVHFVTGDELDPQWVADSSAIITAIELNTAKVTDTVPDSLAIDALNFVPDLELTNYATGAHFTTGDELDPQWVADSTDYLMKGMFNDSLAVSSITESQISDLDHFVNADETDQVWESEKGSYVLTSNLAYFVNGDETDQVWVSDSTDYLMKGQFNDSLAAGWITESQITDLDHFVNSDETDQVWVSDSTDYTKKADNETITGNWINTDNPWAENEIASTVIVESEINTFAELQAFSTDKTLINEEDAIILDQNISIGDNNITNVGTIDVDIIDSDGSSIIVGNATTNKITLTDNTSIAVALGSDAGDDFTIDGTGFVYEGDNTNVGIGTASPQKKLSVIDGDILTNQAVVIDTFAIPSDSTGYQMFGMQDITLPTEASVSTNEHMFLQYADSASPYAIRHFIHRRASGTPENEFLVEAYYHPAFVLDNISSSSGHIGSLLFRNQGYGRWQIASDYNNDNTDNFGISGWYNNDVDVYTFLRFIYASRDIHLNFDNGGNVGIGSFGQYNSTVTARVQVGGDSTNYAIKASNMGTGDGLWIVTEDSTANNGILWQTDETDSTAIDMFNLYSDTGNDAKLIMYDSGVAKIALNTDASSYITGGSLGIGTATPDKTLGLGDGTDEYALSVLSDKLTIWNDHATPAALVEIDSTGNVGISGNATVDGDVLTNANYVMEGYPTGRNVDRASLLIITGTTAGTTCTFETAVGEYGFNGHTLASETVTEGTPGTRFSLSAAGNILTITGMTETVIGNKPNAIMYNTTGTAYYAQTYFTGGDVAVRIYDHTGNLIVLSDIANTKIIYVLIGYVTST